MIIDHYFVIAGISILCLVVNLLHLFELQLINKQAIKQFRFLACFIMVEIIIDALFKALEGNLNIMPSILYVLKTIELSTNPVLPFLILNLFDNGDNSNNMVRWILLFQKAIIIVNSALQIASLYGKFMFYIDENNLYVRTEFTYIYACILVLTFLTMIIGIYYFSNKTQNANLLTLYGMFIMLIAGFILRLLSQNTNFDWLCISITFFIIDIYYVNLALELDSLTQLLNRQVYSTILGKINFSTLIIMIDANNFKSINDTYGHECGDRTLRTLAKCILKAYSEYGWCFRIGGDEFCIILKPNVFKTLINKTPNNDVYVMSEQLMGKLDEIIQSYASKDENSCLHYGVSQGYGIYYYPPEYPSIENIMPLDKVVRLADMRMYQKKAAYKKALALQDATEQEDNSQKTSDRVRVAYESNDPEFIEDSVQE